uniref:R3H domain-containing protein n=1 Tax=Strigamia maritima TaxID=126957 RepID=T1J0U9_STRMM
MADLLGSILNSMTKPPTVGDKQKEQLKKQKEVLEKKHLEEKKKLNSFRRKVEDDINSFIQDPTRHKYKLEPMDKVCRSIVHDIVEVAGLAAFSFGTDELDRYVYVFKKEFAPSDDELAAYRKGEEWDPEKAKAAKLAASNRVEDEKPAEFTPNSNYKEKYEKLIGKTSAKEAARITVPNKQFGFVPSENKRDQRSIEQAMADIKAKKKLKLSKLEAED